MPLSQPIERELIHSRQIECRGYHRSDGLWDIEGHLTDTKTYAFSNLDRGEVAAGEPVHEMWLRLTIDAGMLIRQAEAATDYSPFRICPEITPNFSRLKGLCIGPGWRKQAQTYVGGIQGCTHLVELLGQMGTTAIQTLVRQRHLKQQDNDAEQRHPSNPGILNTCHALRTDGQVVKVHWPQHYTGDIETPQRDGGLGEGTSSPVT